MIKLKDLLKENMGDAYNIGMKTYKTSKPKLSQNESEKKKGVDGKPCWRGYRYAGTENGKDKCIPIKEAGGMCKECGSSMYEDMCQECGYMEEASFTDKHDDNPKLKGKQKNLPDELQAQIVKNENWHVQFGNDEDEGPDPNDVDVLKDELLRLIRLRNNTGTKGADARIDYLTKRIKDLENRSSDIKEGDHEVGMAQNLLQDIVRNAQELMMKIGPNEINLPGWIQDHISKAQNYIDQANTGYHEL